MQQSGPWSVGEEQRGWRGRIPAVQVTGGEGPRVGGQEGFVGYLGVVSVVVEVACRGGATGVSEPRRRYAMAAALRRVVEGVAGLGSFTERRSS